MTDRSEQDAAAGLRGRVARFIEAPRVQQAILAVIIVNAATLGLETSAAAMQAAGGLILALDRIALAIFVVELLAKLYAWRGAFFRSGWNVFDLIVVAIGLAPASEGFTVLRALRVLRVLRLVSGVPSMRNVVHALLSAIPGLGSIIALLGLVYYVASVIATKLYGPSFPDWFGSVGDSAYSLFQIMTLESWSMGIVRPVMEVHPQAWLFFVAFILLTSFTVLNLFIAIIVNAMQSQHDAERAVAEGQARDERAEMAAGIVALRADLARVEQLLRQRTG
ncbi:MAG: ion transporter [Alphaproteobacteria bacterium]